MKNTVIAIFMFGTSLHSLAGIQSSSQQATATLSSSCQVTTTDVAFGEYKPSDSSHTLSSQTINVLCTKGTRYNIGTTASNSKDISTYGFGVTGWAGTMSSATSTDKLYYQILEAHYAPDYWDDGMDSARRPTAYGTGAWQTYTYPYRIPAGQYVKPANYTTTQSVLITF